MKTTLPKLKAMVLNLWAMAHWWAMGAF